MPIKSNRQRNNMDVPDLVKGLIRVPSSPEVIVEIEPEPATELFAPSILRNKKRKSNTALDYSPVRSAGSSPNENQATSNVAACAKPPSPTESLSPTPENGWKHEDVELLKNLIASRKTLSIKWEEIATKLNRGKSAEECEQYYLEELVSEEYSKSVKSSSKKRAKAQKTAKESFSNRDPTRKFKMTKMLADKNFRSQPTTAVRLSPKQKSYAKRYSFMNDPFCSQTSVPPGDSAKSLLQEILPTRTRPSLKLEDNRFIQKIQGNSRKKEGNAETSKRRIRISRTVDKEICDAAEATDTCLEQCLTEQGLQEELVALHNREDEYNLISEEMSVIDSNCAVIK